MPEWGTESGKANPWGAEIKGTGCPVIRENISPGGSADLLAVTIFVTRLLSEYTVFPLAAAQGEEKLN